MTSRRGFVVQSILFAGAILGVSSVNVTPVSGQGSTTGGATAGTPGNAPAPEAAAAEVLTFERELEAATVRGDVGYVDKATAPDLKFTHGDAWTRGGDPLGVDDKQGYLNRVRKRQYLVRDLDSVKVELHGDVAITYGRYVAQSSAGDPQNAWFSVWFERVYEKRGGRWLYVSHRTVHGPTRGRDRASLDGK